MTAFVFSSALAKKPVFNHTNKTITVTDKFMKEAVKPFTDEFNDLMKLRELCPGYEIVTRSHRSPRKTEKSKGIPKFVSYEHMKKYIKLLPDSEKLLKELELVKAFADTRRNSASIVFNWFNEKFPDHRYAPQIDKEGKLFARVNVVDVEAYKKSVEEKEQARKKAKEQAKAEAEPPQADPQDTESTSELQNVG